jgi:hypothetical protein
MIRKTGYPEPKDSSCLRLAGKRRLLDEEAGLVRLAGIEPTTLGFGGQYSIH